MMNKKTNKETKKTGFWIFQESDGWHWSPKSADYLDARGRAYPTKAAARRAAAMAQEAA